MDKICVYPGSFDPLTIGHLDVIERACALFDQVIVAVLHNPAKHGCFPVEERLRLIRKSCAHLPKVSADSWDGMLVDYVRKTGACCVVRGLRAVSDFESEQTMAQINAQLLPGMETAFLMTRPEHACISSSVVREIASFGGDASPYLPEAIRSDVAERFSKR
ncbi:MAG: pantetheine-phosphate adenylyltransferase [Clostridia bacterium]|nr:pantetheine-phosphate adenylyltransferase [Clostridia bacterium]